MNLDTLNLLVDLYDYMQQRSDASNEGDGWKGNEEMSFAQRIEEAIKQEERERAIGG